MNKIDSFWGILRTFSKMKANTDRQVNQSQYKKTLERIFLIFNPASQSIKPPIDPSINSLIN